MPNKNRYSSLTDEKPVLKLSFHTNFPLQTAYENLPLTTYTSGEAK